MENLTLTFWHEETEMPLDRYSAALALYIYSTKIQLLTLKKKVTEYFIHLEGRFFESRFMYSADFDQSIELGGVFTLEKETPLSHASLVRARIGCLSTTKA